MKDNLNVLIWPYNPISWEGWDKALQPFYASHPNLSVNIRNLNPNERWAEILKMAIYRGGPDITEIGSTHVESLIAMDALRPFNSRDIASFGGAEAFAAANWQGCMTGDGNVWAIPWTSDTRVFFYRRDLLAKAGVDETTAFQSPENLAATLQALQDTGLETPLAISTKSEVVLHVAASWIWYAGGNLVHTDKQEVAFNSPEAINGLCNFFSLRRYMAPSRQGLEAEDADQLFREGKCAVTVSGPWLFSAIENSDIGITVRGKYGLSPVLGRSFVGGTNLVLWKQCKNVKLGLELIQYLGSKEAQTLYASGNEVLPSRLDTMNEPSYADHPGYQAMLLAIKTGRSFQLFPHWTLVEYRLAKTIAQIWETLFAEPDTPVNDVVKETIESLARRLNVTLQD